MLKKQCIYIFLYAKWMDINGILFVSCDQCPKDKYRDLPGGTVIRNPPAKAGDAGSSPGPGRSHMPRSS